MSLNNLTISIVAHVFSSNHHFPAVKDCDLKFLIWQDHALHHWKTIEHMVYSSILHVIVVKIRIHQWWKQIIRFFTFIDLIESSFFFQISLAEYFNFSVFTFLLYMTLFRTLEIWVHFHKNKGKWISAAEFYFHKKKGAITVEKSEIQEGRVGINITKQCDIKIILEFPGGTMDKNPPASAGDTGSIPGPGKLYMVHSNKAHEQLLSPHSWVHQSQLLSPHTTTTKPVCRSHQSLCI